MTITATLTAPPGYARVVPVDKRRHAGHGLRTPRRHAWSAQLHACSLTLPEIARAALDYPIAFSREDRSGEFVPVAVLGLYTGQNLYVDAQGQWRAGTYLPVYIRRHPFCVAEAAPVKGVAQDKLVCVEDGALVPDAQPLFDAQGAPTPAWKPVHELIETHEAARQQTRVFTRRLEALNLLMPFQAVAVPKAGERSRLTGLYRVDESKLAALGARDLRILLKKGELRALYAHSISLDNFGRLLDYAAAR